MDINLPVVPFGELYHVGLRVPDVEVAMAELTDAMGIVWARPQTITMRHWVPTTGHQSAKITLTESTAGPVHVELTQGPPGSIWDTELFGAGLHHAGIWVDDVTGTVRELVRDGWVVEMAGGSPEDGYGRFAYVRSPAGLVLEPVSTESRASHERWWAGGDLVPRPEGSSSSATPG